MPHARPQLKTMPSIYSRPTLIGNWFEDRSAYVKYKFKHDSTYEREFAAKPLITNSPSIIWDRKIRDEGHGLYPSIPVDPSTQYFNNYSTTYDLAFNHFPKYHNDVDCCVLGCKQRKHEPYINNFGNLTTNGLVDYKKECWRWEDRNTRVRSVYAETFTAPEREAYCAVQKAPRNKPDKI